MALPPVVYTPPSAATPPAPDAVFAPPSSGTPGVPGVVFTPPAGGTPPAPGVIFSPPSGGPPSVPGAVYSPPAGGTPPAPPMVKQTASLSIDAMGQHAISAVDSRIAGKLPADGLHLFSNTAANWAFATFVPNRDLWCEDLRRFLTGVHMYGGSYHQSYGLQAITPRHCLDCGHGGITVGNALRFVNVDGTVFNTTILGRITDNGTPEYVTDLSIYLTAHELPEWVHKATILQLSADAKAQLSAAGVPTVAVSQGNWAAGPADANTPKNRKVYLKQFDLSFRPAHRLPWLHQVAVGDSGTPEFIIGYDKIWLVRIITTAPSGSGVFPGDYLDYIQALIVRADAAAGISTGYAPTVETAVVLPAPSAVHAMPEAPGAGSTWGTLTVTGITDSGSPTAVPPLLFAGLFNERPIWTDTGEDLFANPRFRCYCNVLEVTQPGGGTSLVRNWAVQDAVLNWAFLSSSDAADPLDLVWALDSGPFTLGGAPVLAVSSQPGGGVLPPPAITTI